MRLWQSIGFKFIFRIACSLIIILLLIGIASVSYQRQKFEQLLNEKVERTLTQLTVVLRDPLWTLNDTQIHDIIFSHLKDPDILAMRISNTMGNVYYWGKDPITSAVIDLTKSSAQSISFRDVFIPKTPPRTEINNQKNLVGDVEVTFSRHIITMQVRESMMLVGMILVSLLTIETIVLFFFFKQGIRRPLQRAIHIAQKIAMGEIGNVFAANTTQKSNSDEIGRLLSAFQQSIQYLHDIADVATHIAIGDLRHDLVPKSEQDVLGQAFQQMTRYLKNVAAAAHDIANGDLRATIQPLSEHDVLGTAFFQQTAFLQQIVSRIIEGSRHLEIASESLTQVSTNMAASAEQFSEQTHSVSANSHQISDFVSDMAASIAESSGAMQEISKSTITVANMTVQARQIVNSTKTVIAALETRSQEIGEFIHVITDIAQQTNLLALNASIEAARSGDAGRGFAVVANEVKELARETARSAEDVIQRVEAIQQSSQQSVKAIQQLSAIIQEIENSTTVTASAAKQQNATIYQNSLNMSNIAENSEGMTHTITELVGSSDHLSQQASTVQQAVQELGALSAQLQQMVECFRI